MSHGRPRMVRALLRRRQQPIADALTKNLSLLNANRPSAVIARLAMSAVGVAYLALIPLLAVVATKYWFSPLSGLCLFGLMMIMGPLLRLLIRRDAPNVALHQTDIPQLFSLLDDIAKVMRAPQPDRVILTPEYNAAVDRHPLTRKVTVKIGFAMWDSHTEEERVWVLAHELGHLVNKDPGRGGFAWAASATIDEVLSAVWEPVEDTSLAELVGILAARVATSPLLAISVAVDYLWFAERQLAEYRADSHALRVGGSAAAISAIEAFSFHTSWQWVAARYVNAGGQSPFIALREIRRQTPRRDIERRLRVSEISESAVDLTHPATHRRLSVMRAHGDVVPQFSIDPDRFAAIDSELEPHRDAALHTLRNGSDGSISFGFNSDPSVHHSVAPGLARRGRWTQR
jgi:Zn-dependent protease with chaperone function